MLKQKMKKLQQKDGIENKDDDKTNEDKGDNNRDEETNKDKSDNNKEDDKANKHEADNKDDNETNKDKADNNNDESGSYEFTLAEIYSDADDSLPTFELFIDACSQKFSSPPSRQNKHTNEHKRKETIDNEKKKRQRREAAKRATSTKSQKEAEKQSIVIQQIDKHRWNNRQNNYEITVTFSDGSTSTALKEAIIEDLEDAENIQLWYDYVKTTGLDFSRRPEKKTQKETTPKITAKPFKCVADHTDIMNFQNEEFPDYFQPCRRLEKTKCHICHVCIMPKPKQPVLVCKNVAQGCKVGYCQEHMWENQSDRTRRRRKLK